MKTPTASKLPSGSWCCRVMVDGKRVCITKATEKEAVAEAMAIKAGMKKGIRDNETGNITLRDAIDKYLADRYEIYSPSTIRSYRTAQRNRFKLIMDEKVNKITPELLQKAIDRDAKTVCRKTITNAYGLVNEVLAEYDRDVPISRLTLPKTNAKSKRKKPPVIYDKETLIAVLRAIKGTNVELPVLLAAWMGLRRSEISGLRWEDVDFKRHTITVEQAMVPDEHNHYVIKGTKTDESYRTLICPQYIMDLLAKEERHGERVSAVHPETVIHRFKRICNANNVPCYGLHRLRKQMASVLLELNVPDKEVMELGGWSNIQTPRKIYQQTTKEGMAAAVSARDEYYYSLLDSL